MTRQGAQKSKITTRAQRASVEAAESERKAKFYGTRKPNTALAEAKKRGKLKMSAEPNEGMANPDQNAEVVQLKDIYGNAIAATELVRGATGLVYDEKFAEHRCLWDDGYPECPERFTRVLERCQELKLVERCVLIEPRMASKEEVLTKHTPEQVEILKETQGSQDVAALEELSSHYDAVYIHPVSVVASIFVITLLITGC